MRVAVLILAVCCARAAPAPHFEQDVLPILEKHCLGCHGAAQTSGLDLRTPETMRKGGSKGPALVKGSAERSLLYQRILDKSMPFGPRKLTDGEAQVIRNWIDAGANAGHGEPAKPGAGAAANHWAFRAPVRPQVPIVRNRDWVRTPVDAFILAALEDKGIAAPRPAGAETLRRRLYLDVIGLPPEPEERRAWTGDQSREAYSRLVDSLLARPQYGERWARRWLDVVRYAESNGYERDGTKPQAWRYRDYVINALNQDKPFDRFLTEQLAGDEAEGSNAESQIGTTFLRLGTWDDEPADPALDRYDQLDDIVGAASAAFLGVTLRCARCHDHKFEPFPQKDYYRFLAVFDPLKRPQKEREDLDRFVGTEPELAAYRTKTAKADAEIAELKKKQEALRNAVLKRVFSRKENASELSWNEHAGTVLAFQTAENKRTKEQKELVRRFNERLDREIDTAATEEERPQLAAWRKRIAEVEAARPKEPVRAYVLYEDNTRAPATRLLHRGDPNQPGEEVDPGVPGVFPALDISPVKPGPHSSGRRLWLARWMTHPENPLVARVIVNRLWQWHFGEGLVASENDFGVMGQRPSNAALLDYLAAELVESRWSIKHIQRLILNSSTFLASAEWNEAAGRLDPDNVLCWRWKPRRLEAEVVRDAMLAVSGELNLEMAGPSIYPALPRAVLEGQSRPGEGWGKSDDRQAARRSIYIFSKRSLAVPELEVLDAPDTTSSCEQRDVSTTGPQALIFLNGDFTRERAQHLAARLRQESGSDRERQIRNAYELAFGRKPNSQETAAALRFLANHQKQIEIDGNAAGQTDAATGALQAFCLVVLNSNEFFYLE
jgi:hypothetical protein